jgi:sugar phosphate isomerase/epimerase
LKPEQLIAPWRERPAHLEGIGEVKRKLSFTTMGTPQLDHAGAIRLALEAGFDGVDLRCADYLGEVTPASSEEELGQVARDFEAAGLEIPSLLCYHQVGSNSEGWPGEYAEHISSHLAIGAALGARAIRIFGVHPAPDQESQALVRGSAKAIAAVLSDDTSGVGIVMQNHAGAGTALDALDIARELDDPRFGLVYSPDHSFMHETNRGGELLPQIQPWTRQVYVADLMREGDGQRWVFPGRGEVPLRETIAALDAAGFDGFYSFKWEKIWNPDLAEPEVAMPQFISFMESV